MLAAMGTAALVAALAVGELQASVTTGTDYHDHGDYSVARWCCRLPRPPDLCRVPSQSLRVNRVRLFYTPGNNLKL
jgi:hypothetical protein